MRHIVMVTKDLERLSKMFDSFICLLRWQNSALDLNSKYEILPLLIMFLPFTLSFFVRYVIALLAMAFYTLIERKFLGYFQIRKGPNKVRISGIPQPFADAIKLFIKEQSNPMPVNYYPFLAAPLLGLILTLLL